MQQNYLVESNQVRGNCYECWQKSSRSSWKYATESWF